MSFFISLTTYSDHVMIVCSSFVGCFRVRIRITDRGRGMKDYARLPCHQKTQIMYSASSFNCRLLKCHYVLIVQVLKMLQPRCPERPRILLFPPRSPADVFFLFFPILKPIFHAEGLILSHTHTARFVLFSVSSDFVFLHYTVTS